MKPGPKFAPKFYKKVPRTFPKFVPKFARIFWAWFLQYGKIPANFGPPLAKISTPPFWKFALGWFCALFCPGVSAVPNLPFWGTSHALCRLTGPQRPNQKQIVYNADGMGWEFTHCSCYKTTQASTEQWLSFGIYPAEFVLHRLYPKLLSYCETIAQLLLFFPWALLIRPQYPP